MLCAWLTLATSSQRRAWVPPEPRDRGIGPLLQTGVVSSVSATGYPRAKPTGNRSEAVSMIGVFLPWHLWSNNNPQRKGYQCFLETHDRVYNLSLSTASKLLHTQDYTQPQNWNDIPNHKHNSVSVVTVYPQDSIVPKVTDFLCSLGSVWDPHWERGRESALVS